MCDLPPARNGHVMTTTIEKLIIGTGESDGIQGPDLLESNNDSNHD